jgi:hypothetical protein
LRERGEVRVSRTASPSYLRRGCFDCGGHGFVPVCETPESRPSRCACVLCEGRGSVSVYVYRRPPDWRGRWPPREVFAPASPPTRPVREAPSRKCIQLSLWPGVA